MWKMLCYVDKLEQHGEGRLRKHELALQKDDAYHSTEWGRPSCKWISVWPELSGVRVHGIRGCRGRLVVGWHIIRASVHAGHSRSRAGRRRWHRAGHRRAHAVAVHLLEGLEHVGGEGVVFLPRFCRQLSVPWLNIFLFHGDGSLGLQITNRHLSYVCMVEY